jgi:hypothetical protein
MANERPWYADWRVWFCMAAMTLGAIVAWVVGLPFRILDGIRSLFF